MTAVHVSGEPDARSMAKRRYRASTELGNGVQLDRVARCSTMNGQLLCRRVGNILGSEWDWHQIGPYELDVPWPTDGRAPPPRSYGALIAPDTCA